MAARIHIPYCAAAAYEELDSYVWRCERYFEATLKYAAHEINQEGILQLDKAKELLSQMTSDAATNARLTYMRGYLKGQPAGVLEGFCLILQKWCISNLPTGYTDNLQSTFGLKPKKREYRRAAKFYGTAPERQELLEWRRPASPGPLIIRTPSSSRTKLAAVPVAAQ